MSALVSWPLGTDGDLTLLVLQGDGDRLVPILGGEPEPEDGSERRMILAEIADLEVDVGALAEGLKCGPDDVWVVVPRSDEAYDFYRALCRELITEGRTPADTAFLPAPVTLEQILLRLPSGRDVVEQGCPSRQWYLRQTLLTLWAADAPDELLGPFVLARASGAGAFVIGAPRPS